MAFITTKLSAGVKYSFYEPSAGKINRIVDEIEILGGADVINRRSLETPSGIVTEIEDEKLEKLKTHPVFQTHLKNGYITILSSEKEAKKADKDLIKDNSSQLTPEDYENGNNKKVIKPRKKPTTKK